MDVLNKGFYIFYYIIRYVGKKGIQMGTMYTDRKVKTIADVIDILLDDYDNTIEELKKVKHIKLYYINRYGNYRYIDDCDFMKGKWCVIKKRKIFELEKLLAEKMIENLRKMYNIK